VTARAVLQGGDRVKRTGVGALRARERTRVRGRGAIGRRSVEKRRENALSSFLHARGHSRVDARVRRRSTLCPLAQLDGALDGPPDPMIAV